MLVGLGVTGCIAAYKSVEVMRGLQKAGLAVQAIMTRAAEKFVGPLTFEAISGRRVVRGMFTEGANLEIQHIRIAQEIQLLAVVPATADILGKFAHGIADDSLTTIYLSTPAPVLVAPAMNVEMWRHAAVADCVRILRARGHEVVDPGAGALACGMEGPGRLAEVSEIVGRIMAILHRQNSLSGLKVLVTAGPTVEDLDPVRFLSNRSSGKMGYAIAAAARRRGAAVSLISGPTHLPPPAGVELLPVRSAAEMYETVIRLYPGMDVVVKAAAVSDYRPRAFSDHKIKKSEQGLPLDLVRTQDILAALGAAKRRQYLVGFAAETEETIENGRRKLREKNLDLIVANNVSRGVFGEDEATVHLIPRAGEPVHIPQTTKAAIAERLWDYIETERRSASADRRAD